MLALAVALLAAPLVVEPVREIPLSRRAMPMTTRADARGRPFLYIAAKEGGLRVHALDARTPDVTLALDQHAMSLEQSGDRLFVALGNHWGRSEAAGLAVVDVANPRQPRVLGRWKEPTPRGAGGAVAVQAGVAYLAAMQSGLYVLDVADPTAIRVRAHLVPDPAFPDRRPDRAKVNARGLALDGDRLYLCYDAGGLRVLDVADPDRPREIARWSNPAMNGKPRAYNNVIVDGDRAYVSVDYVGIEILDVAGAPRLTAWWNPWNPRLSPWKWFGGEGHANELALDAPKKRLYVSAGKTDLAVLDVSDPAHPRLAGAFGAVDDTRATWGVSRRGDHLFLSYICTLGIPFRADWAGVRVLRVK